MAYHSLLLLLLATTPFPLGATLVRQLVWPKEEKKCDEVHLRAEGGA